MPIGITDKFKPKNNADIPLMDAEDIAFREGRLSEYIPVVIEAKQFEQLKKSDEYNLKTPYLVYEE